MTFKERVDHLLGLKEKIAVGLLSVILGFSNISGITNDAYAQNRLNDVFIVESLSSQKIPDMMTYQDIQLYAEKMINDRYNTPVYVMKLSEFMDFINKGRNLSEIVQLSGNIPDIICFRDTVTNRLGASMRGYFVLVNDYNQSSDAIVRYSRDYVQEQINNGRNKTLNDALGPYVQQSAVGKIRNVIYDINILSNTVNSVNNAINNLGNTINNILKRR